MVYIGIGIVLLFISVEVFIYLYGSKQDKACVDYILVLGCLLYGDALSPALQRRMDAAIGCANKYPTLPIIVSGGKGDEEKCSEASAMKNYLLQHGIDEKRILVEDKSVCTYTNFAYTKKLLGSANYKLYVVSCDFHMYRAMSIGKNAGFMCYRWPAKSTTIKSIKNFIREFGCIIYFWITKR